jgi:hypothetical protein
MTLGGTWQFDLSALFEDADGDALTYSAGVNGVTPTPVSGNIYRFTPAAVGEYTLSFKASDGKAESSAYTVKLLVKNAIAANAIVPNAAEVKNVLNSVSAYQIATVNNPSVGSVYGEWAVLALARGGYMTEAYKNTYLKNLYDYIRKNNGNLGQPYTDYSRIILALSALEVDATNVAGYNLVARLAEYENVVWQGVNGSIYALLALDSKKYDIPLPTAGSGATQTTRERLIRTILNAQLPDGGWSMMEIGASGFTTMAVSAEVDTTAMALQSLAPYYKSNGEVREAVDKALTVLSGRQSAAAGDWASSENTAQTLVALNALNIALNDARFVKNGKTAYDGLMRYYDEVGGYFRHTTEANAMSTDQAMYALVSLYRTLTGANSIYDMTDEQKTVVDIPASDAAGGATGDATEGATGDATEGATGNTTDNTNSSMAVSTGSTVSTKKLVKSSYAVVSSASTDEEDADIETPAVEQEANAAESGNISVLSPVEDNKSESESKPEKADGGLSAKTIIGILAAIIALALLLRLIVRRRREAKNAA